MAILLELNMMKLHKHLNFPLKRKIDDDGVRNFTNNMGNGITYIDKTGLEDLVEFQTAEFNIIDGYYFTEGRNETINHAIEDLYNLRLK